MPAWARAWKSRGGGWPHIIVSLAGFDPAKSRWIRQHCTLVEIAEHWKDYLAANAYETK